MSCDFRFESSQRIRFGLYCSCDFRFGSSQRVRLDFLFSISWIMWRSDLERYVLFHLKVYPEFLTRFACTDCALEGRTFLNSFPVNNSVPNRGWDIRVRIVLTECNWERNEMSIQPFWNSEVTRLFLALCRSFDVGIVSNSIAVSSAYVVTHNTFRYTSIGRY